MSVAFRFYWLSAWAGGLRCGWFCFSPPTHDWDLRGSGYIGFCGASLGGEPPWMLLWGCAGFGHFALQVFPCQAYLAYLLSSFVRVLPRCCAAARNRKSRVSGAHGLFAIVGAEQAGLLLASSNPTCIDQAIQAASMLGLQCLLAS